jgi:hypothetical protein
MRYVVLLTSSIHPQFIDKKLGRNNPQDREKDCYEAVKFYLSKGFKVVFVDNSNTRSELILNLNNDFPSLEYLFFQTQRSFKGKSHGEVEIMKYALEHSILLKEVDYLIKITGRYIIKNLQEILDLTNGVEKEIYINPTRNLRWADSRLMIMRKSYCLNYFFPAVDKYLDETKKVFMENAFMKSLLQYLLDGGELNLWTAYPAYDAYDGTHNEKIKFGRIKRLKYLLYYKIKKFVFGHRA